MERRSGREGMGCLAEVYDAEMLALLRGLETAIEVHQGMPRANGRRTRIVLFADNTTSVTAITKEAPGSSGRTSQKFVETATPPSYSKKTDGQRSKHRGPKGT